MKCEIPEDEVAGAGGVRVGEIREGDGADSGDGKGAVVLVRGAGKGGETEKSLCCVFRRANLWDKGHDSSDVREAEEEHREDDECVFDGGFSRRREY